MRAGADMDPTPRREQPVWDAGHPAAHDGLTALRVPAPGTGTTRMRLALAFGHLS